MPAGQEVLAYAAASYAHTGLLYSSSHGQPDRTSCRSRGPGLLVEIDRARRAAAARADRALAARANPLAGACPATCACPRRARWRSELGVSRGVVTEAYGQLAAEGYLAMRQGAPVRVARAVRAAVPRAPARSLLESYRLPLPPRPARPGGVSPRGVAALAARRAARLPARPPSATAIPAGCRSCAKRSPTTWGACAAWTPTPSTCSCAPASCRGSRWSAARCAARGVQRDRAGGPRLARAPPDRRTARAWRSCRSRSTSRACASTSSRGPTRRRSW